MSSVNPRAVELPGGVTLPYVDRGDASALPVLLLHGFAGSWRSFEPVLRHLPDAIHAPALTQRGHGEASKPSEGYHLEDLAADAAAFMDAFGLEQAVIVGHSMGSACRMISAAALVVEKRGPTQSKLKINSPRRLGQALWC